MSKLKYYDEIQAYLADELPDIQKEKFESDLLSNKELKLEYDASIATNDAINVLGYERIKRQLNSDKAIKIPIKKKSRRFFIWAAAASFLLLFSLFLNHIINNTSSPNQQLIAKYSAKPNLNFLRNSNNTESPFTIGALAYDKEKYDIAIKELNEINSESPLFGDAQYILGCTYLEVDKADNAITNFNNAINAKSRFEEDARWNIIMANIKKGEFEIAKKQLDTLQKSDNLTPARKADSKNILEILSPK